MRVAFVIPYFYPAMWYGGTPRAAYETARALVRRGHEGTVLTPHGGLQQLGKKSAKVIFDMAWGNAILRDASGICAISPLEEMDARFFGVDEHRIHRFPSPIDADPFEQLPKPGEFASKWRL